jgi:CHAT domain-containing protein
MRNISLFRPNVRGLPLWVIVVSLGAVTGAAADEVRGTIAADYPGLTAAQVDRLKERDPHERRSRQLYAAAKLAEAAHEAKAMMAIEREVLGERHRDVEGSLEFLAEIHLLLRDFAKAHGEAQQALDIAPAAWGLGHWRTVDARLLRDLIERVSKLNPLEFPELQEADRLRQKADGHRRQRQHHLAVDLIRRYSVSYKKLLGDQSVAYATSLVSLAVALHEAGNLVGARPIYDEALAAARRTWGERHPRYAQSLDNLGAILFALGDLEGARPPVCHALELRKDLFGNNDYQTWTSLIHLAGLLLDSGDPAGAEPLYREALEIAGRWPAANRELYADTLSALALALHRKQDLAAARSFYEKTLDIRRGLVGETHPAFALTQNALGRVIQDQGDLASAEAHYRRALAVFQPNERQILPGWAITRSPAGVYMTKDFKSYDEWPIRANLESLAETRRSGRRAECGRLAKQGEEFERKGELAEAVRTVEAKMNIEREACGENSDEVAGSSEWLARLQLKRYDFAAAHRQNEGLANLISIRLFGDHWQAIDARMATARAERLGRLDLAQRRRLSEVDRLLTRSRELQERKDYTESIKCASDALVIQREVLGDHDPETVTLTDRCGMLHLASGDADGAITLLRQSLELSQQVIGEHHPDNLLVGRGEEDRIRARQRVGASHPDTLVRACHLVEAYLKREKPDEAAKILAQARAIRRASARSDKGMTRFRYDGQGRLNYAGTSVAHAEVIRGLQDSQPAKDVLANEALLHLQRTTLGPDDEGVVETLAWLAEVHEAREEFPAAETARRAIHEIRTRTLGPEHWRTTLARWDMEQIQGRAKLSAEQRKTLDDAERSWSMATSNRLGTTHVNAPVERMQRALAIRRRVLGKCDPRYADGLVTLGKLVQERGDFAGAEPLLELGLDAFRDTLGERSPATAEAMKALGLLRLERGRFAQAEALLRRAAELEEPLLGARHPLYLRALYGLALSQVKQNRPRDARQSVNESNLQNEQAMDGEDPSGFADRLAELAELRAALGEWAGAKRLYERCLEILPPETNLATLGSEGQDVMSRRLDVMSRLSALHRSMGDLVQAKAILERVIDIQQADRRDPMKRLRENFWSDPIDGLTEDARELSRRHPSYARRLQDLGDLLLDLGDHQRAMPLLQQALSLTEELLGADHPDCALRLASLARAATASGDMEKGQQAWIRALDQSRRAWGEGHPVTLRALNSLAEIYIASGKLDSARPLLEQSLARRNEQKGNHPDEVAVLANLSQVLILQQDFARSRILLDRALVTTQTLLGQEHPGAARVLDLLASWHLAQGNIEEARRLLERSVDVNERYLTKCLPVLAERERIALMSTFHESLSRLFSLPADDRVGAALYQRLVAWKGISGSGRTMLNESVDQSSTPGVNVQALRQELEQVRSSINRFYQHRDADTDVPQDHTESIAREFREAIERRTQLESQLARVSGWKVRPLTHEQVAATLPEGTALVDVFRYTRDRGSGTARPEPDYLAFVLRRGSGPRRIELGRAAAIDAAINRWRQQLEAGDAGSQATGSELARLVWTPLASALRGVSTVIIAPDGDVSFLPWAALPDAPTGSFLIERFAFGTVLSARQLVEPDEGAAGPAAGELLAVGGVDYGQAQPAVLSRRSTRTGMVRRASPVSSRKLEFAPLPGTRDEVEAIALVFQGAGRGDVQTLSGPRATKSRVLDAMPGKRYLHLATHGYFAPPEMVSALAPDDREISLRPFEGIVPSQAAGFYPSLLSGFVLAGAGASPRNAITGAVDLSMGLVTAEEISALDLSACDLAVLSACETGLGRVAGGEGVLGLQRAFHQAGVKMVVASLWRVEDEATRRLMLKFYTGLWKENLPPISALRQAQLSVLADDAGSTDRRGPGPIVPSAARNKSARTQPAIVPRSWAAWVISGSPCPLERVPAGNGDGNGRSDQSSRKLEKD